VVPASEKDPEGWSATDKFTVVLETAGLTATELSAYCRERGLFPEQVERWRQAFQDANDKPVLTLGLPRSNDKVSTTMSKSRSTEQAEDKLLSTPLKRWTRHWHWHWRTSHGTGINSLKQPDAFERERARPSLV
jgi:transposase